MSKASGLALTSEMGRLEKESLAELGGPEEWRNVWGPADEQPCVRKLSVIVWDFLTCQPGGRGGRNKR